MRGCGRTFCIRLHESVSLMVYHPDAQPCLPDCAALHSCRRGMLGRLTSHRRRQRVVDERRHLGQPVSNPTRSAEGMAVPCLDKGVHGICRWMYAWSRAEAVALRPMTQPVSAAAQGTVLWLVLVAWCGVDGEGVDLQLPGHATKT